MAALPWLILAFHFWPAVERTGASLPIALGSHGEKEVGENEGDSLFNLLPRAGSSGLCLATTAGHGSVLRAGSPEITQTWSLPSSCSQTCEGDRHMENANRVHAGLQLKKRMRTL